MNKQLHTPGPWQCEIAPLGFRQKIFVSLGSENLTLAEVYEMPDAYSASNARLIAAAPELLALLQSAVYREDNRHNPGFGDVSLGCLSTAIRAVLAKAEGV